MENEYLNLGQISIYVFWAFFALLIIYLRREDKREGYPLDTADGRRVTVEGFPKTPPPKQPVQAKHPALVGKSEAEIIARTRAAAEAGPEKEEN